LAISQEDVNSRHEYAQKDADRQKRKNARRKITPKEYEKTKRQEVRSLLHASQGVDPVLVGASSRRTKPSSAQSIDLTLLPLLNVVDVQESKCGESQVYSGFVSVSSDC
jgi:hypothetical protein